MLQFAKFKTQVKQHKAVSRVNTHQYSWRAEAARLAQSRKVLEHELEAFSSNNSELAAELKDDADAGVLADLFREELADLCGAARDACSAQQASRGAGSAAAEAKRARALLQSTRAKLDTLQARLAREEAQAVSELDFVNAGAIQRFRHPFTHSELLQLGWSQWRQWPCCQTRSWSLLTL